MELTNNEIMINKIKEAKERYQSSGDDPRKYGDPKRKDACDFLIFLQISLAKDIYSLTMSLQKIFDGDDIVFQKIIEYTYTYWNELISENQLRQLIILGRKSAISGKSKRFNMKKFLKKYRRGVKIDDNGNKMINVYSNNQYPVSDFDPIDYGYYYYTMSCDPFYNECLDCKNEYHNIDNAIARKRLIYPL
jgi:hypothetical protein